MIDDLIQQLQDPDPAVRRSAIIALGKSKDPAALKPLAAVVRGDSAPALSELARKAGQYIRQQSEHQTRPSVTPFTEEQPAKPTYDDDLPETDMLLGGEDAIPETGALLSSKPSPKASKSTIQPLKDLSVEEKSETTIVRGRKYNVGKDDQARAKQYLDAALSLSISGDNAKAMKNLTEAISFNPNLINDQYFNNVAGTVTGLDGNAAAQMIIDRNKRKDFTDSAARAQKERRVEQHMTEAQQSTQTDVWLAVILYLLIVVLGPIIAVLITNQLAANLVGNFTYASTKMPEALRSSQAAFAGLTVGTLLPLGIIMGISAIVSLGLQITLIHATAKAFGGIGTWQHLVAVLLGFYNKWLLILFLVLYITIAVMFVALFSPIAFVPLLILIGLTFYVIIQTAGKVGEAYDFGAGKGCLSLIVSVLVVGLINLGISYVMFQALSLALSTAKL